MKSKYELGVSHFLTGKETKIATDLNELYSYRVKKCK